MKNKTNILNTLEISKGKILKNLKLLQNNPHKILISPVLKSNAYGHGIDIVGNILDDQGLPFICVNSFYEASLLRDSGFKSDVLIMGYVDEEDLKKEEDFIFAVFDLDYAKKINSIYKNARVHINVETGLHREGIDVINSNNLLDELKLLKNITIEGVMSHLACSNDPFCETTKNQLENFRLVKKIIKESGIDPKWFHLGGSLALLNNLNDECNVVRCGKALFGIALNTSYGGQQLKSDNANKDFLQTLVLKTKIAQVKKVKKGEHVGYADMFIAKSDMTIGVLPIGYYDGLDRRLTNKGRVKVNGKYCEILGLVAMNLTVINLSEIENPLPGNEVIVYSNHPEDFNSLDNTAKLCETLPQELLVRLPVSLTRVVVD